MTGFIQQSLSFSRHLLLFALVLLAWPFLRERPNFNGMPDSPIEVRLDPRRSASPEGWTLHGSWTLRGEDPRLTGFSGLDCREGRLDLVTDLGDLVTLPIPSGKATRLEGALRGIETLYEGEALLARAGSYVIAQENDLQLLFVSGGKVVRRVGVPNPSFSRNKGIEALLETSGQGVVALHEAGRSAYLVEGDRVTPLRVEGARGAVTGAARRADGQAFVLMRGIGPTGFRAWLAALDWDEGEDNIRVGRAMTLPLPANANAEGLCIEPRGAKGSTRLWVVSDDNGLSVLAQRLVAWEIPDDAWPAAPERAGD